MTSETATSGLSPTTARGRVREDVRRMILSGELKPGTRLTQQHLAKKFGVAQSVVRESLLELQSSGLVRSVDNLGIFVSNLDTHSLIHAYHIREVLEGLAARLCCERASRADIKALYEMVDRIHELALAGRLAERGLIDRQFHHKTILMSGNPILANLTDSYQMLNMVVQVTRDHEFIREEHRAIVEAIESGNGDEAEKRGAEARRRRAGGDCQADCRGAVRAAVGAGMRQVTRRSFMQTVAGAAAGVYVAAAKAQATRDRTLRWGVIGTGHRAGVAHIPAIKSFPDDMELVALCDVMDNHLAAGVKKAGGSVQTFTDYQKLLASPDINAVMIATPNMWHKEMVIAALEAGKHVMCEKPMACSIDECKAMKSAAEKRPELIVLYSMQLRYSPRWMELRKTIESGKIGKPKQMLFVESRGDWNRGDVWQYDDPKLGKVNWRFSHRASGGTLNEKVCHYFDIMHWMAGAPPKNVSCVGGISVYRDGRDTWDHATTMIRYADDLHATHQLCMFGPKRSELQIIGDAGALMLDEKSLTLQIKNKKEELSLPDEIAHGERGPAKGQETAVLRMYKDFLDCVRNKTKPWMDADKAMVTSKTAWLGELSNERKKEVAWDDLG